MTNNTPLPERMRPRTLDEVIGQSHLTGPGKLLRQLLASGSMSSIIFWGPPGSGKTTLARIIASELTLPFIPFSAVTSGIKEVRDVMKTAQAEFKEHGIRTLLFIDEIHRFNKAQQDAFLPFVENGTIILIGATTENPSFHVINALLSRARVITTKAIQPSDLVQLLRTTLADPERGLGREDLQLNDAQLETLANFADGDARMALGALELLGSYLRSKKQMTATDEDIEQILQQKTLQYDKDGEGHFDLISALHKCMRDSDPDAALYWLGRMLEAGEPPLYIARRVIRFASEDVGLAAPQGLQIAIAAWDACHYLGMPECNLALAQAVTYLATAPKSNALYAAYQAVQADVYQSMNEPPPLVIRNAPTKLMKELGYGKGYQYAHDAPDAKVDQNHLPDRLAGRIYYHPTERGFELEIKKRMKR